MPKYKATFIYTGEASVEKTIVAESLEAATAQANLVDQTDLKLLWSGRSETMKLIEVKEIK